MTAQGFIAVARKTGSPGAFIKAFARWFFGFEFLQEGTAITVQRNADGAVIGVDLANLVNYLNALGVSDQAVSALPFWGRREGNDLKINGGNVYTYQDGATAVADYDDTALASRYYWVEVQISTSQGEVTVTGSIQNGASAPTYLDISGSPLKLNVLIGQTDANKVWSQKWAGGHLSLAVPYVRYSVVMGNGVWQLSGDALNPGAGTAYGCVLVDATPTKGWHSITDLLKSISGYNAANNQVLTHVAGTVQWQDYDACS